MPTFQNLLFFMAAALALNFTPGPDVLFVIARSTAGGRAAGVVSALGIAAGCLFHIGALALGFVALLEKVPVAYDAIRLTGAAYLVFLGVRAIARPSAIGTPEESAPAALPAIFRQALLTNVLNPKVALFFLAFIPQFVDPRRGNAAVQLIFLGLLFNVSGTLVNLGVAVAASHATQWLRARQAAARALQRLTGGVFIALGLRLAFARQR